MNKVLKVCLSAVAVSWLMLAAAPLWAQEEPTGSATLSWTALVENTDGTPLVDLAGYWIYYGLASGDYTETIKISNASLTSWVVDELIPDTYYFVATAYNAAGVESAPSNEAVKNVEAPLIPNPPTGLPHFVTVAESVYTIFRQPGKIILVPVGTIPLGTACDVTQTVNGRYSVPMDDVEWSGNIDPVIIFAECG